MAKYYVCSLPGMSRGDYIEVDSWLAAGDKYNVCVGGPDRLLTYMYS